MKNGVLFLVICIMAFSFLSTPVLAAGTKGVDGEVTGKSIGAGALSLLVWPGIGQAVNDENKEKVITHAVLGLTGIFRIWSCYDAVVDRHGGVWHNRI